MDRLQRHLTTNRRLVGPIDDTDRTPARLLSQLIATDRATGPDLLRGDHLLGQKRWVMVEDPLLEKPDPRGRLEALLRQVTGMTTGRSQGIGLTAQPVQSQHQQRGGPFPGCIVSDQRLEILNRGDVLTDADERLGSILDGVEPGLFQTSYRLLGELLVFDILEGTTTPEGKSFDQKLESYVGAALQMGASFTDEVLEPSRVELNGVSSEQIGLAPGEEDLGLIRAVGLELVPEVGDMDSQGGLLPPGLSSRPDGFDDLVSPYGLI
jgi:hypothetical protein